MYDVDPADPVAELEVADAADEVPTRASSHGASEPTGGDEVSTPADARAATPTDEDGAPEGRTDGLQGQTDGSEADADESIHRASEDSALAGSQDGVGRLEGPSGDAAPAGLNELAQAPLSEHPEIYERIHAELQGALAEIDGG